METCLGLYTAHPGGWAYGARHTRAGPPIMQWVLAVRETVIIKAEQGKRCGTKFLHFPPLIPSWALIDASLLSGLWPGYKQVGWRSPLRQQRSRNTTLHTGSHGQSHNAQHYYQGDLDVPFSRISYGERRFPVSGPTCWNALPSELKLAASTLDHFCSRLKTVLFIRSYYAWEQPFITVL